MDTALPPIPAKRYFTIGEVSELCGVKPYVLRYWEQEFTQLRPMKRRGNRRYYQHHEVLLVRRIRELLYDHGFTISGARNRMGLGAQAPSLDDDPPLEFRANDESESGAVAMAAAMPVNAAAIAPLLDSSPLDDVQRLRAELIGLRQLLRG